MVEVEILDEEEYLDRTEETMPVAKVLVTYRVGNITVGSFSIEAAEWKRGNQESIILKKMIESKSTGIRKLNV